MSWRSYDNEYDLDTIARDEFLVRDEVPEFEEREPGTTKRRGRPRGSKNLMPRAKAPAKNKEKTR
jgi:hypothetical protein